VGNAEREDPVRVARSPRDCAACSRRLRQCVQSCPSGPRAIHRCCLVEDAIAEPGGGPAIDPERVVVRAPPATAPCGSKVKRPSTSTEFQTLRIRAGDPFLGNRFRAPRLVGLPAAGSDRWTLVHCHRGGNFLGGLPGRPLGWGSLVSRRRRALSRPGGMVGAREVGAGHRVLRRPLPAIEARRSGRPGRSRGQRYVAASSAHEDPGSPISTYIHGSSSMWEVPRPGFADTHERR
jgi:hypothetical protein